MAHEPVEDPRILEAMEAYRPDRDDLARPELRPLASALENSAELRTLHDRLRRLDSALADAFGDVPVPVDLEARILARLSGRGTQSAPKTQAVAPVEVPGSAGEGWRAITRKPGTRRAWGIVVAVSLITAVALLLGVLPQLRGPAHWARPEDLLTEAIQHFVQEVPEDGKAFFGQAALPHQFPFPAALQGLLSERSTGWSEIRVRSVAEFLGQKATAYDLIGPHGVTATVYVSARSANGLPSEVPPHPMLSTGETSASVWQEGDWLCVLVVHGGISAYERLLSIPVGPVT